MILPLKDLAKAILLLSYELQAEKIDLSVSYYLAPISYNDQIRIFNHFKDIVSKEEERCEMIHFKDSKINVESLMEFNNRLKFQKKKKFDVLSIVLDDSGLKIACVKIHSGNQQNIQFSDSNYEEYKYLNNNLNLQGKFKWYDWVVSKIRDYGIKYNLETLFKNSKEKAISGTLSVSFKLNQKTLDFAQISEYSNSFWFSKEGILNDNLLESLNKSLSKMNLNIKIECIVNDAVAAQVASLMLGYRNPVTLMGESNVNSSFMINRNGKRCIVNSELGYIKLENIFCDFDPMIKSAAFERNYQTLQILKFNQNFIDAVKMTIETAYKTRSSIQMIDWKFVDAAYYGTFVSKEYEDLYSKFCINNKDLSGKIKEVIKYYKTRNTMALAPLIVASAKSDDFTLILTGKSISKKQDSNLFAKELEVFIKNAKINCKLLEVSYVDKLPLFGSAYISILSKLNLL